MVMYASTRPLLNAIFALAAAVLLLGTTPAYANARPVGEIQQEFNTTFQKVLDNPSDVPTTLRYAELAVEMGDYESAIPPLERILMYNPKLSEVRLEVGILYYLLNSHTIAKQYLEEVKQDSKASPELTRRAEEYLARM